MSKFKVQEDGEWVRPKMRGYKIACCDCGLVHKVNFKITKIGIMLQVFRDNRSTGQVRRHMKNLKEVSKEVFDNA